MLALTLTGAALLLASRWTTRCACSNGVASSGLPAIAIVTLAGLGLIVAFGFTLIPPAIEQGKALIHDAPQFVRSARGSALFRTLDARFHLADYVVDAGRRLPEMLGARRRRS